MALRDSMKQNEQKCCRAARVFRTLDKDDIQTLAGWVSALLPASRITEAIARDNPDNIMSSTSMLSHLYARCNCPNDEQFKGAYL